MNFLKSYWKGHYSSPNEKERSVAQVKIGSSCRTQLSPVKGAGKSEGKIKVIPARAEGGKSTNY